MGYLVINCIMCYIIYYIVTFTATFGWQVAWTWYYCCMAALVMQLVVLDPLIAIIHWLVYRYWKNGGRWCQRARSLVQGFDETYDPSDGELEERRIEEQRKIEEAKAAKAEKEGKKVNRKKKKKGGLFGEVDPSEGGDNNSVYQAPVEEYVVGQPVEEEKGPTQGSGSDQRGKSSGHDTAEKPLKGGSGSGNNGGSSDQLDA